MFHAIWGLAAAHGILGAAVPAALEQFDTSANAYAWRVYNYADGLAYFPEWDSSATGFEYIWLRHRGDEPLEFSADAGVAGGALVGNYAAANVKEVSCDIFIEELDDFDQVDCSVLTKGADGVERWYYSLPYTRSDFTGDGWWVVRFGLNERWSFFNGAADVTVIPDAVFLASIKEVSVTFFPRVGAMVERKAAIDDFILEPGVTPPPLAVSSTAESFRIAFTPAPGLSADLQQLSADAPFTWIDVAAEVLIKGPSPHVFTTPVDAAVKIFRVKVTPAYAPIATPQ